VCLIGCGLAVHDTAGLLFPPCCCYILFMSVPNNFAQELDVVSQQYDTETLASEEKLRQRWLEICRRNLDILVGEVRQRGQAIINANPPLHDPEGELDSVLINVLTDHMQPKMKDQEGYDRFSKRFQYHFWESKDWCQLRQDVMDRVLPDR